MPETITPIISISEKGPHNLVRKEPEIDSNKRYTRALEFSLDLTNLVTEYQFDISGDGIFNVDVRDDFGTLEYTLNLSSEEVNNLANAEGRYKVNIRISRRDPSIIKPNDLEITIGNVASLMAEYRDIIDPLSEVRVTTFDSNLGEITTFEFDILVK